MKTVHIVLAVLCFGMGLSSLMAYLKKDYRNFKILPLMQASWGPKFGMFLHFQRTVTIPLVFCALLMWQASKH